MPSHPSPRLLAERALQVTIHVACTLLRVAVVVVLSPRARRREHVATQVARLAERLGGAFLKMGQLLATRVDLVGQTMATALGRLHDSVEPMTGRQALKEARAAFGRLPAGFEQALRRPPVASGSIACVYRADLDGRDVAIKVRRPGIARRFAADILMLRLTAQIIGRLPPLRRVPMVDIVTQIGDSLTGQLDFARETDDLRRLRADLAGFPEVVVPGVVPGRCAGGVITMDYIDDLDRLSTDRLPRQTREAGVVILVQAVYRMLFVEGFIHVDLHQGNVYFQDDGKVVILDAGFTFRLSDMARTSFTKFFAGMIQGDGEGCAEILLSTVRGIEKGADVAAFRHDVAELVVRNAGAAACDFDLAAFSVDLFDLQRRHRLFAEPEFVFPLLCLLSLEGTVRRLHPLMDFQLEAAPHVMHGLLINATAPAGRG
ncbi:ABC1 kinase family protein [Streptosporangium sp. NPDC050855]|uniref:ABC1 kinase family protein n=1 Tax=Streptosporangium sp. NPDC050855 TaxID=3366194 RepID=UPI0037A2EF74